MQENTVTPRETVKVDKLASSTKNLDLGHDLTIADPSNHRVGDVVVVRTLTDNASYNRLELRNGRLARIKIGDVIAGVLGRRRALKGFVGDVPTKLATGDKLHLLNLGGLVGRYSGRFHGLGRPIQVEVLGSVVKDGRFANIADNALPKQEEPFSMPPLIIVAGTSMNTGKTQVVTEVIKQCTRHGYKVAGAKLSGVAALRDVLNMEDHGAVSTLSFLDCGLPSTVGVDDLGPLARTIIHNLVDKTSPDLIVIELGDGLLGGYKVITIFDHEDIRKACAALVLCASDFVGVLGGIQLLQKKFMRVDIISGPATDSKMGIKFIKREFSLPSANAINDGPQLYELVKERLETWKSVLPDQS